MLEENWLQFWTQHTKYSLNQVENQRQQKKRSKLFPSVVETILRRISSKTLSPEGDINRLTVGRGKVLHNSSKTSFILEDRRISNDSSVKGPAHGHTCWQTCMTNMLANVYEEPAHGHTFCHTCMTNTSPTLRSRERRRTHLITSRSFKESANHREGSHCFGSTNYFN